MTLLASVVDASERVAATRSRKTKTAELAAVLSVAAPDEVLATVVWLAGETRQGRIGIGWRTLSSARPDPAAEPSLTVTEVDAALTELTTITGAGSTQRRKAALGALLGAATASEQKFLIGLITGELRQGALEGVMTEAIAAASGVDAAVVRRAVMLSGDLARTAADAITGGEETLRAVALVVGRPVRPMLASPGSSMDEAIASLGPDVVVEYKLDGARIQVHRTGDDVLIVTRTLRDITSSVPELVELVRGLPCESVVLDGETLALADSGRPRPFQETMSRFGSAEGELLLSPWFFDCLHLDGVDLLDAPLEERLVALERVAGPHRIPSVMRPTPDEAAAHLDAALAAGHEGAMVKDLASPYSAGRRGKSWQKIKPEHTLDLVVIGVEWGSGRRSGWLSNLHLGARDPDGGPPIMVGKTFKGLTDELLRWQTEELPRYETHRDGHTVYLRPEIVVEIELDGAQTSSRYPGGVALRFARVLRYRPDKTPAEADTVDTVRAMRL
ncbi:ATP-dependent DNA ligase [Williamsia serinedens]|uniref:Probable DNA ligase n=1 Tax=Williamsia serinedens TaxID=391736 RepID=A0ABT1GYR9_9NOCA|nr:ATP-dependent DNA ligase [Williamsia serinedens]MCP2159864.1 DNA ligase-1 [Williamsia serinedens]